MTVAASIILAAVAGGIIFVLLDSWQRRGATPTPDPQPAATENAVPVFSCEIVTEPEVRARSSAGRR